MEANKEEKESLREIYDSMVTLNQEVKGFKDKIVDLFKIKGKSLTFISKSIEKEYKIELLKNTGKFQEMKTGVSDLILEILGCYDYNDYKKKLKVHSSRIEEKRRRDSGFTKELKATILKKFNNKCIKCGSIENIHIHHKDGDSTNNEESNLIALCSICHNNTHKKKEKLTGFFL